METLITRLREPSTYAALAAALVALGINIDDAMWSNIILWGTGFAALVGAVLGENGTLSTEGQLAVVDIAKAEVKAAANVVEQNRGKATK